MVVRFKASIYRLVAAIALAVFLPVLSQTAFAQIPVDVDFGIRGGVFNSGGIPLEVPNNHYFPDVYTTDQPQFPVTVGPTIGVLFNGHWYVRLEAARSRFSFHYAQGTNSHFPYDSTPQVTSVTEGHSWQYPLLLSYVAGHGPVQPFGGGGLSFGSSVSGTTSTTTTSLVGPPPAPGSTGPFNTTTTTSTARLDTNSVLTPYAFYITGGVDARTPVDTPGTPVCALERVQYDQREFPGRHNSVPAESI